VFASYKSLLNDLDHVADEALDAKPEDNRVHSSFRILFLSLSLQEKMFKDRCVLFPDEQSASLIHSKDEFVFKDLIEKFQSDDKMSSFLSSVYQNNPSEFCDPESFSKLSSDLAADVAELVSRLQSEYGFSKLEKCLMKLHMCSSASHHSKLLDFENCLETLMKIQTFTLQSIILHLPPQPQLTIPAFSSEDVPHRSDIRAAFLTGFALSIFDLVFVLAVPLAACRWKLLISAFESSRKIRSSRTFCYSALRIAFRVFLDCLLLVCSVGVLLSVVGSLPFISRMYDAWKSKSISYARNIIIVILHDFWNFLISNLFSCCSYNFTTLFWSLSLVAVWAGFLPAMIVYVAINSVDFLKNHKLFGFLFTFSFWTSMAVIVPMYGLLFNVASARVIGSELGSVVWFLVIMIAISLAAAIYLSLNRDKSKPAFSAATQRLPIRKNFSNIAAVFDVVLDGIQ
jgi:hypothetical protein